MSRGQEKTRPQVSRGEGSPAEAEPTSGPRLITGPAQCLEGPQGGVGHVGAAGVEAASVAQQV